MLSDVITFAEDLGFIEGPVWNPDNQTLSVVSINRGCVYTLDLQGTIVRTAQVGGGPNGMALASSGLLVAQNGGIFGASGPATPGVQSISDGQVQLLFSGPFAAPNDLAFGPDNRLYVTDPATDRAVLEPVPGRVLACDFSTGTIEVVVEDRFCPNGLAFTAGGKDLLLALTQPRQIERFRFEGGRLGFAGLFCELHNGRPDGLAVDEADQVWACTPGTGGVELFSADGDFVARYELGSGSMTTNLCFGGSDNRDLFITASGWGRVLKMRTRVPGLSLSRGPLWPEAVAR